MRYIKAAVFSSLAGLLYFAFAHAAGAATLGLSPASGSLNPNDTLTVTVNLDTQGAQVDGVDIRYLNFNPNQFQVEDSNAGTSGVQITPGSLMPNTLANSVDNSAGRITFSQVVTGGQKYTGSGVLATINFKVIAGGTAPVTFSYTSGNTTDSNVASNGSDVLTSVTNASYTISGPVAPPPPPPPTPTPPPGSPAPSPTPTPTPPPSSGGSVYLRLVNEDGTFYVIKDGQKLGVTNPGMLFSYGLEFKDALPASAADRALPKGALLSPGGGALVKHANDPTVWLISGGLKHGFTSASVFLGLGFKFNKVLVVTAPELNTMAQGSLLDNSAARHLPGVHINASGTVFWLSDTQRHGYPSIAVWNSWNPDNDFSYVVPANAADMSITDGEIIQLRVIQ